MKFGQNFKYNGSSTEEKNLILCSDESVNEYALGMEREMIVGNTTHVRHESFGLTGKYSDMLELNIMLIKDPGIYTTPELQNFGRDELREITAWLTSPNIPLLLEFEDYDESQEPVDFFGNFISVTAFSSGEVFGLKATFRCSAPWGYTKEQVYSSTISESDTIMINNTSDDWESSVYPYITITPTAMGETNFTIENKTDGGSFSFKGVRNVPITIDCRRLMVFDSLGLIDYTDLGWTTDTLDTLYWPRLIHGWNEICITGSCKAEIRCRYPRKVGET